MARGAPVVRTEAVLLRRTDYGDADRVATFMTRSHGRVALLCRSARSSRRRFGASLEPFQVVEVAFAEGSHELGALREARVLRAFPRLSTDLTAMSVAGEAIERLRARLSDHQPEPRVFDALVTLFAALETATDMSSIGARFELRTLALLGHAPLLSACVSCQKALLPGRAALFSGARGGVVCRDCGGGPIALSGATVAAMRRSMETNWAEAELDGEREAEARQALEAFVLHHATRPGRTERE